MQTDQVTIRTYHGRDREACRELWCELTEHHREIYSDTSIGGTYPGRYFDGHLERVGPERVWLAELGGTVVGMVSLIERDEEVEVEPIVVTRGYRRRGIGEALLKHALGEAEKAGLPFVCIRPVIRNVDAIRLFHRTGFQTVGSIELFVDLKKRKKLWKPGLRILNLDFCY